MPIAYAVNPDARLSWGGLPAPGRDLSSARPDACHLIETEVDVAVFAVAFRGPMGWLPNRLPAAPVSWSGFRSRCRPVGSVADTRKATATAAAKGPGGQPGNDSDSSAAGSHPERQLFGQATPEPSPTL